MVWYSHEMNPEPSHPHMSPLPPFYKGFIPSTGTHRLPVPKKASLVHSITLTQMARTIEFLSVLFLLSLCFTGTVRSDDDCVYTVYIRTGSIIKGGTDSIIGLKLYDTSGYYIYITNLEAWGGLMDPGHNYFERGNLDIFSGSGPCLDAPVCAINLTSDGSGSHHGWYCNYVEVTTTGVHRTCAQQQFTVEQWLALDTSPYELWAVRNYCPYSLEMAHPTPKAGDAIRFRSASASASASGSGLFSIFGPRIE